jgi:hypothetical protein
MEANKFRNIVTSDESLFAFELQQFTKWSTSREDVPQRVRQQIGTRKVMLTVIWGVHGFQVADLMTSQYSFDSQYFMDNIMVPLVEKSLFNREKSACSSTTPSPGQWPRPLFKCR